MRGVDGRGDLGEQPLGVIDVERFLDEADRNQRCRQGLEGSPVGVHITERGVAGLSHVGEPGSSPVRGCGLLAASAPSGAANRVVARARTASGCRSRTARAWVAAFSATAASVRRSEPTWALVQAVSASRSSLRSTSTGWPGRIVTSGAGQVPPARLPDLLIEPLHSGAMLVGGPRPRPPTPRWSVVVGP